MNSRTAVSPSCPEKKELGMEQQRAQMKTVLARGHEVIRSLSGLAVRMTLT